MGWWPCNFGLHSIEQSTKLIDMSNAMNAEHNASPILASIIRYESPISNRGICCLAMLYAQAPCRLHGIKFDRLPAGLIACPQDRLLRDANLNYYSACPA